MKISVITACLNEQETIEATLISIANQSYKDIEHIVIDGCSTDNTIEIINKYKDKISNFISEPDCGIYDAMNKGIKLATGDFIFFLNANDTFYSNNTIEEVVKKLRSNSSAKILFGDIMNVTESKCTCIPRTYDNVKNIFFFLHENICHQCIFYHKSLFEELGCYSNNLKLYADWDFNVKCMVQNKKYVVYLPQIIANFQIGGISSNASSQTIVKQERKAIINKYYKNFRILIDLNNFFEKNYSTLYRLFVENLGLKKIYNKIVSKEKFRLNIN